MNILFDVGHPAHVHLLRYLYFELIKKKHSVFVTVKDNLITAIKLLNHYNIQFISIGSKADNIFFKAVRQISYDIKIAELVWRKNIRLGIGSSINLAHASKITKMDSIILDDDDDEVQPLFVKYAHPFCDLLLSPDSIIGHRKKKDTLFYSGYHELAYLHPKRFQPDMTILETAGIKKDEKYFILRFNSFKAHHDIGVQGLSLENKKKLINLLKPYGKIYITSERELESEFKEYRINIASHQIHSFIAFAAMFIGDSQTMTSEASILGTPALKCNSFAGLLSVPNELENKYELCLSFLPEDFNKMLYKIEELLKTDDLKKTWQERRIKLLNDKIDVTGFLIWMIEYYPDSIKIFQNNPEIQYQFR